MGWGTQSSQQHRKEIGTEGVWEWHSHFWGRRHACQHWASDASVSDGCGDKSMRAGGFREGFRREAGNSGPSPVDQGSTKQMDRVGKG